MGGIGAELLIALRLSLGAFFVPSAIKKLLDPVGFRHGVGEYQLLPRRLSATVAMLLPWVEGAVGAALLAGVASLAAGVAASVLMIAFIAALAINVHRGRDMDCHCYGAGTTTRIGPAAIARNCLLFGLSLAVATLALMSSPGPGKPWWTAWGALTSATDAAVVLLLANTVIALIYLVEWAIHSRAQAATAIRLFREASA